jgi:hypothetical protein
MPPRRSVSRLALAFVLVGVGAMALFVWRPIQRAWALAELQNSIHGVVKTDAKPHDRPARLPKVVDDWAHDVIVRFASGPPRSDLYHQRFRALFADPTREIQMQGIAFRGDPGAVLACFPGLETLKVYLPADHEPTEAELTLFFRGLRRARGLKVLVIAGARITDASLAPLAGHPRLERLVISRGHYTPEVSKHTFSSLPSLKLLCLVSRRLNSKDIALLQAALPFVKIQTNASGL